MKATSVARRLPSKVGFALLTLALAALLAACGTPASAVSTTPVTATPVTPTATLTPPTVVTPSPTVALPSPTATSASRFASPTPQFWCDSFWTIEARAWIDSDGDGERDADELPLAGVQFTLNSKYSRDSGMSDEEGQKDFHTITGCSGVPDYTVAATPPAGYSLTTPGEVQLKGEGEAAFGFAVK